MNKVLFYGDSNVFGYDPRGMIGGRYPAEDQWINIVAAGLKGKWKLFSDGMNGRIIPDNPYGLLTLDKVVLEHSPLDMFVIVLGTNDLLGMATPNSDVVTRRLRDFVERELQRAEFRDNKTRIFVVAPPMILSNMDDFLAECEAQRRRMATQFDMIAQEFGLYFADAGRWDLEMAFDGIHLSEEGHRQYAAHMIDEMNKIDLSIERREADDIIFA